MTSIDWNALMSSTSGDALPPGLYVCPTPIGNLEDITLRVLRVLEGCDLIAAEDTRHTLKLLNHFGISKRLVSYHEHNIRKRGPELAEEIRSGQRVALVSDAGMPGVSDPGADLVKLCLEAGLPVTVLPGPSASITALVGSGLRTDRFLFAGFQERHGKKRREALKALCGFDGTVILYESPHRIGDTLNDLLEAGGDRKAALCRELTKRYEEYRRGSLTDLIRSCEEKPPKGELVLLLEGDGTAGEKAEVDEAALIARLEAEGRSLKEMAKTLAEATGRGRNELYQELLARKKQ